LRPAGAEGGKSGTAEREPVALEASGPRFGR
jgi:hypothetical protein